MRGLKFLLRCHHLTALQSHPSRVRGLKYEQEHLRRTRWRVAPFTGAWIEIGAYHDELVYRDVAPFTGAWIEMTRAG